MIELFTSGPAGVLNMDRGTLAEGYMGDVTILNPELAWTYDVSKSMSKSRNSPFHGHAFQGAAVAAVVGGKIVHVRSKE
jgi:dihydroorotase